MGYRRTWGHGQIQKINVSGRRVDISLVSV